MACNVFPKVPLPQCLEGKERGKFARYDKDGRKLVYIGMDELVMHQDVIDRIEAEFEKEFGGLR